MNGVKARREQQDKQATAAARAARPGRGLRKANTMHVYEGHAETGAGQGCDSTGFRHTSR
jgi:hypothetical protein